MDIFCPKCGEPWEIDSIHERVAELNDGTTFTKILHAFQREGCIALDSEHGEDTAPPSVGYVYELLGDDIDGAAAWFDEFGLGI